MFVGGVTLRPTGRTDSGSQGRRGSRRSAPQGSRRPGRPEPAFCGPAGLLYLCMKHVTDRYNMYYSYAPTKLNEQIHMAAVYQAIFAPLLGLFWMLFFSILRLGRYRACLAFLPLPLKPSTARLPCASREGPGGARAAHDCSPPPPGGFSRPQVGLRPESQPTSAAKGRAWTNAAQLACALVSNPQSKKQQFLHSNSRLQK